MTRAETRHEGGRRSRWAVVLAGGAGRRLRTMTADAAGRTVPKQYCALRGERSLLQLALARAERLVPEENIVVVVNRPHRPWWSRELASLPRSNVIVQPEDRGTAAGLLLPLLAIRHRDPHAEVVVLPSDHWFDREDVFAESVEAAFGELGTEGEAVVLLGMRLRRPDEGLGWIVPGKGERPEGAVPVAAFHEKPPRAAARRLIDEGALGNSFVMVGSVGAFLRLLDRHSPLPCYFVEPRIRERQPSAEELTALYRRLPRIDLSRDVLAEAASELRVLAVEECGWSDLGTPFAVRRCLLGHRVPRQAPRFGCRAPVDLSSPRPSVDPAAGVAVEELSHYTEML